MAASSPSSPSATTPTRPARAWRYLPVRFSLWQLFAAMTLVAIGIVGWKVSRYLAVPYREAESEQLIIARLPPLPQGSGGFIRYVTHAMPPVRAWRKENQGWSQKQFETPNFTVEGLCWRVAGRTPVRGLILVDDADFTDLEPVHFSFAELACLSVSGDRVRLTEEQLDVLLASPMLRILRLRRMSLTQGQIEAIARNQLLEELELSECKLSDEDIAGFRSLDRLSKLDLTGNQLSDKAVPRLLAHCPNLEFVLVAVNPVGDESARAIGKISSVESVYLSATLCTDEGVAALTECQLVELGLDACPVTERCFRTIAKIRSLKSVYLDDVPGLNLEELRAEVPDVRVYGGERLNIKSRQGGPQDD